MPYTPHKLLSLPNDDVVVWRYMDFPKYVALLRLKSLYFCRADKIGDPFEGSIPKGNTEIRRQFYKELMPHFANNEEVIKSNVNNISKVTEHARTNYFLNCWHVNEFESAAMWNLYATKGIALKSNILHLKNCFEKNDHQIFISQITYKNYLTETIPDGNTFFPIIHKWKSFEFEREIRAIVNCTFNPKFANSDEGQNIAVDLDKLVDAVVISPTSPKWLQDTITEVTKKFEFDF